MKLGLRAANGRQPVLMSESDDLPRAELARRKGMIIMKEQRNTGNPAARPAGGANELEEYFSKLAAGWKLSQEKAEEKIEYHGHTEKMSFAELIDVEKL